MENEKMEIDAQKDKSFGFGGSMSICPKIIPSDEVDILHFIPQTGYFVDDLRSEIKKSMPQCINYPVPPNFANCTFELDSPSPQQQSLISKLVKLCNTLEPDINLYICGSYGVGKTHSLSAYANSLQPAYNKKLSEVADFLRKNLNPILNQWYEAFVQEVEEVIQRAYSDREMGGERRIRSDYFIPNNEEYPSVHTNVKVGTILDSSKKKIVDELEDMKKKFKENFARRQKPAFIGFVDLCKLADDSLDKVIQSPILCVDDIPPLSSRPQYARVMQMLIETRYDRNSGGLFVTSNMGLDDLIDSAQYAPQIAGKLKSRCNQMFEIYPINDAADYRARLRNNKK